MSPQVSRALAAGTAAAVIAIGAYVVGRSSSDSTTTASPAFGAAPPAQQAGSQQQAPQGAPPGLGQDVTGATADKVGKAALAKYPGTIERIAALPDGSYVAHVITSNGELHVLVSKDFKVTGTEQGGGPPPGVAPQGTGTPS